MQKNNLLSVIFSLVAVLLGGSNLRGFQNPPTLPQTPNSTSPYEGLPVREIRLTGLNRVSEQLVRNQLRTAVGHPYSQEIIDKFDVTSLTRLNQFHRIRVQAELTNDGGVIVTFVLSESPLIQDVQVTGNNEVSDQEITQAVRLRGNDPVDIYQINIAREAIEELYHKKGYYLAAVDVDDAILAESNIVLFTVREGPRVRIRSIEFRGNQAFRSKILHSQLKTKTWLFLLRAGELDTEAIARDIQAIIDYYRDRGFLDVRVDHQIDLSNDRKEAKLIFRIEEGPVYTMRDVRIEGATRLQTDQARALMVIKTGDVYSQDKIQRSITAIKDYFGRLGYYGTTVSADQQRYPDEFAVSLLLLINEAPLAFTGEIRIIGNEITKRQVIIREVELRPDRPLNEVSINNSISRLRGINLFNLSDRPIVVLPPADDDSLYRDVIIEIEEKDTAKFGFGAAVSSDFGVLGSINFEQRNFDITDTPESFSEFFAGRAFRGAGQTFNIALQPGAEFSSFSIGLTEPYIFGTNNSFSSSLSLTNRELESWDEDRAGGRFRLARRLGEFWVLTGSTRLQTIDLKDIDADAPNAVFDVEGENTLSAIGVGLTRTTYDSRIHPTRGSKLNFEFEQVGAFGGDFDFSRIEAEHSVYLTIDEDFLGRKTILEMSTRIGYLFGGDTPTYERFYLGGRGFRGFDFRTISPKGIQHNNGKISDDPIGGDWLFFWGLQLEYPIFGRNVSGVVFLDTGTVTEDVGFEDYRASAGFGFRLLIPAFGQAPMGFDFGIPLKKGPGDDTRLFSFSVDLPL